MRRLVSSLLLFALSPLALAVVITGNPSNGIRPSFSTSVRQQILAGRPTMHFGRPTGLHASVSLEPGCGVLLQIADDEALLAELSIGAILE